MASNRQINDGAAKSRRHSHTRSIPSVQSQCSGWESYGLRFPVATSTLGLCATVGFLCSCLRNGLQLQQAAVSTSIPIPLPSLFHAVRDRSQRSPMELRDGTLESPLLVAFQWAIFEIHRASLRSIANCVELAHRHIWGMEVETQSERQCT